MSVLTAVSETGGVDWKTMPGWAVDWADAWLGKYWRTGFWVWWYRVVDEKGEDVRFAGVMYPDPTPNAVSFRCRGIEYTYTLRREDAELMYASRQNKSR